MDVPKDAMYSGPKVRKISLIEYTVKSSHCIIYNVVGIFGSFVGELEVSHGGIKMTVPHISLNESGVCPGFQ
jgi:hypothetical protein